MVRIGSHGKIQIINAQYLSYKNTNEMPLFFKSLQIISVAGINAKTATATKLYTTENGTRTFYTIGVTIECTAASAVITPMTASVGTNATSYNNIMAGALMAGLSNSGLHLPLYLNSASATIPPNTDIYLNVTIGAVATSQAITVHFLGFYG